MKDRYKKFVYEDERGTSIEVNASKGKTLKVLEGADGELIIREMNDDKAKFIPKIYLNYANPPILDGYKHVCGEWNNGFVIERISDGSQFVWIPVGSLDSDGTLDGEHFSEKFGRRNYRNYNFSDRGYHEPLECELLEELESVKTYGGFYISRYNISKNSEGQPQSVKGVKPCRCINFNYAKEVAATIESNEAVKSHLTFGAEYDSVLAWFIKSGAKTLKEIAEDSSQCGNYRYSAIEIVKTGRHEEWRTNNIYDLAGNVRELTQEKFGSLYYVIRGGNCYSHGFIFPVAYRSCYDPEHINPNDDYSDLSFRAVLCIK